MSRKGRKPSSSSGKIAPPLRVEDAQTAAATTPTTKQNNAPPAAVHAEREPNNYLPIESEPQFVSANPFVCMASILLCPLTNEKVEILPDRISLVAL
eukprot:15363342-Ditylum_brightwellii.AAC.1